MLLILQAAFRTGKLDPECTTKVWGGGKLNVGHRRGQSCFVCEVSSL